jgi:hypothetical protein
MAEKFLVPVTEEELAARLLDLAKSRTDYTKRVKPMLTESEAKILARYLLADLTILRPGNLTDGADNASSEGILRG